jgi:hypothetical protein
MMAEETGSSSGGEFLHLSKGVISDMYDFGIGDPVGKMLVDAAA